MVSSVSTGMGVVNAEMVTAMSTAFLANQLPPLSKFDGATSSSESVKEWLEQFELVAGVYIYMQMGECCQAGGLSDSVEG